MVINFIRISEFIIHDLRWCCRWCVLSRWRRRAQIWQQIQNSLHTYIRSCTFAFMFFFCSTRFAFSLFTDANALPWINEQQLRLQMIYAWHFFNSSLECVLPYFSLSLTLSRQCVYSIFHRHPEKPRDFLIICALWVTKELIGIYVCVWCVISSTAMTICNDDNQSRWSLCFLVRYNFVANVVYHSTVWLCVCFICKFSFMDLLFVNWQNKRRLCVVSIWVRQQCERISRGIDGRMKINSSNGHSSMCGACVRTLPPLSNVILSRWCRR